MNKRTQSFIAILTFLLTFARLASAQSPGVRALVQASSDVAVFEVVSTAPRKAIEGARDTAELKVIQPLKGTLIKGDVLPLYYHLIFKDLKTHTLEKPKFEKGKRYIVFLTSQLVSYPVGTEYPLGEEYQFGKFTKDGAVYFRWFELADQWLGVVDENPELAAEIIQIVKRTDEKKEHNSK